MANISNEITTLRIEDMLKELASLQTNDFELFLKRAAALLERKKLPDFNSKESLLIDKIKNGGPVPSFWEKHDQLAQKLTDETMIDEENQTFLEMTTQVEEWSVERLQLMMELSERWNVTLDEVRQRLDVTPRATAYA